MERRPNHVSALAAAAALMASAPLPAQETPIEELIIYGLDGDYGASGEGGPPGRLFRFRPADGTYKDLGGTYLEGTNFPLWDWESLCYIPSGPNKGAYSVPCEDQAGAPSQKLVRISMFDASCAVVGTMNLGNVRGMTVAQFAGEWKIVAARTNGNSSRLSIINPANGLREGPELIVDSDPGPGVTSMRLFGLARDLNGVYYGIEHVGNNSKLWRIDLASAAATAPWPADNSNRVEALEVAVGNTIPAFSGLPAATAGWNFDAGTLMGFGDNDEVLYVFDMMTGQGEPIVSIAGNPITVPWTDVEGIVFLTEKQDPQSFIVEGWD